MLYKEITLPYASRTKKIPNWVFIALFAAIIGFTFLGCINLFAKQGLLILISLCFSLVYIGLKGKITLSITAILSLAFTIAYSIPAYFFHNELFFTTLLYALALPIYVQLFSCFYNKKTFLIGIGSAYVVGLFISFILMLIMTYWCQGNAFGGEVVNNFWTHELVSRTGVSLYQMGFLGACVSLLLFKSKFRKWYTIPGYLFIIALCFWFALEIGNRSFLLAIALLVYAMLFVKIILSKKWVKWFIIVLIFSLLLIGVLIVVALSNRGIITIPPEILKIPALNRLFTVDPTQGRPELLREFLSKFYLHPFGDLSYYMEGSNYVHNLVLDFYTFGGVFSFFISTTFFVFLAIYMVKFILIKKGVSSFEKALIFGVIFGVLGIGFSEPIYQANPNCATFIFLAFLYMNYMVSKSHKVGKERILEGIPEVSNDEEEAITAPTIAESSNILEKKTEMHELSFPSAVKKGRGKAKAAIILITFNKSEALLNSFNNLMKVDFLGDKVDLIVSVDYSGTDDVENTAKALSWPYGNLIIRTFDERQGLKAHVLHCFEYAEKYEAIFLLEDDIYCSEAMYAYGMGAARFYDKDPNIAGISLYNFQGNWQNWSIRFEPYNIGYDSYFVRLAQSWGEVVTTRQWKAFKKWFDKNQEFVKDEKNVPSINKWPDSSWLKYFDRYCFLNNKFFVYPYVSVVTNCNGVGIHNVKTVNDFQVELQGKKTEYNFQPFDPENSLTICYDEYFDPLWIDKYIDINMEEVTIDLWCTKPKNSYKQYVLTAGYYGKQFIKSWSLSLHPIELSLINNIQGEGIYLYESELIKKKKPDKYDLLNYSCRTSDWRRIKFYSFKLFFKTYWGLIKKKFKKIFKK